MDYVASKLKSCYIIAMSYKTSNNNNKISCGCGASTIIGMAASICISWVFNHSVWWCILHAFLSWFYVAYKVVWYVVTHY